jgi:hypothetical protein
MNIQKQDVIPFSFGVLRHDYFIADIVKTDRLVRHRQRA